MLELNWTKCERNSWCGLITLNLSHRHFDNLEGVYIIWHGGNNPKTVRVGQGEIRDRLGKHREDNEILAYNNYGLFVTWARVVKEHRDGVERYLAERLKPLIGSTFPNVTPIGVNLPRD